MSEPLNKDQLYQTALHEAGHAIAAVVVGKRFKDVNIRAKDDHLGRIRYWVTREALFNQVQGIGNSFLNEKTIDKKVKSAIVISYAGYVSELKGGFDNTEGAAADFEFIADIGLSHAGLNVDAFLEQCLEDTKQLVDSNWAYILKLSQLLLKKKSATGKDVRKLVGG